MTLEPALKICQGTFFEGRIDIGIPLRIEWLLPVYWISMLHMWDRGMTDSTDTAAGTSDDDSLSDESSSVKDGHGLYRRITVVRKD
jgi:hypothetical protein